MRMYVEPPKVPFMALDKYSQESGMPMTTLRDQIRAGKLIIKNKEKRGEKTQVNMVAMHEIAAREAMQVLG